MPHGLRMPYLILYGSTVDYPWRLRLPPRAGRRAVLGLATGSTPLQVYRELVRLHREEGLSFAHVTTFNLDEYWPMAPDSPQVTRPPLRLCSPFQ